MRFVAAAVLSLLAGCSSSATPSSQVASDAGGDTARPSSSASDADPPDAAAVASAADAGASSVPRVEDGLYMALQGTPPPQPGSPTPFVLVGCPAAGHVEVHAYVVADDGSKTDAGRHVATFAKNGITNHLAVGAAFTVDVDEKDSFAVAPFVYRATVVSDPSFLETSDHQFVARMLNPDSPDLDDVGILFPEKLVRCND